MPVDRLRIAYLANPNETHTRRWIGWFAARGHDVVLLVSPDEEVAPGLPKDVSVIRWDRFGGGRVRLLGYIAAWRILGRLLREVGPDVVHAHYLTTYGWLAWVSGFRPYGITAWGSDLYHDLRSSRRATFFGRLALRGAAFVTADSRDLVRATRAAGARPERTAVVQFGVEIARFAGTPDAALRESLGLTGVRVVFSPRTIMPIYNHDVVIRALATLPEDVHLLMSARAAWPEELARVEALITELGVRGRVRIVSEIAYRKMADHYLIADAVVSVPTTDATPVTMFEAMASGRPLVASDVPSLREWLADVQPEYLVPIGDVDATAAAIRAALALDPPQRDRLAVRLREVAAAYGDHDRNMATVEALYQSAARGKLAIPRSIRAR